MNWTYVSLHHVLPLPFGTTWLAPDGASVRPGEVVARGVHFRATRRVRAAGALGVRAEEVRPLLRVGVGEAVSAGGIVARSRGRFARAVTARDDCRLIHVGADGDLHFGLVGGTWEVRSPIAGEVARRGDSLAVRGEAWILQGLAGFGPDGFGTILVAVDAAAEDLPARVLDTRAAGRIVIGGARASGEVLTRAHAVGASGVVAASVSFRALRAIYGDDVGAFGHATREDFPTALVLGAFGAAPFPPVLFDAIRALEGAPAAIDTAGARLYVTAPSDASLPILLQPLELDADLGGASLFDR